MTTSPYYDGGSMAGSRIDVETVVENRTHQPDIPCPFDGEVDVTYEGAFGAWECPACGEIDEATR